MNQFLRSFVLLSLVGIASAAFGQTNIDSYYYWNLTSGEGWINDGALWTSEDGLSTGYVPGTTDNTATETYRDWAVIRNAGLVKVDADHIPWDPDFGNAPQNIWVGHGSEVYFPGPFAPSAGHVLQTSGIVGYQTFFVVGRGSGPEASTYDLQGGSIVHRGGTGGRLDIGNGDGGPGVGVMTVSNAGSIQAPAQAVRVGTGVGATGTLSMSDSSQLLANYLTVGTYGGDGQNAVGTVNLSGDVTVTLNFDASFGSYYYNEGTINLSGNATLLAGRRINVGDNSSYTYRDALSTGQMNISDNATVTTDQVRIGKYQYGRGTATVASATGTAVLNATGNFAVGIAGGHGELIVGDGGVVNHSGDWVDVGSDTRVDPQGLVIFVSTGTVTMNGGVFNHTDANTGIALGVDGQSGTWTQNDGALVSAGRVWFGQSGGTALLNLNGGTFEVPTIAVDVDAAPSVARINFNGGTLKAAAAGNLIVDSPTPVLALKVQAGGAVIDSNSFDVVIDTALVEDEESTGGGLTKLGVGTLTLGGANTYTGDTSVMAGTLSTTSAAMLADQAAVWIAAGAMMNLNFAGTDTIGGLYLNGVAQTEGTWGASGSGATYINDTYFSGTGVLLIEAALPPIPGDANGDQKVNDLDAKVLAANWGAGSATWAMGDFNDDQNVDAIDGAIMAANWGYGMGGESTAVPEPTTLAGLAGMMLLGLFLGRRGR